MEIEKKQMSSSESVKSDTASNLITSAFYDNNVS